MATLQFQREQLAKTLCVIELKLKALSAKGGRDMRALKELQDDQIRHQQLLQMIDQHLKINHVAERKY